MTDDKMRERLAAAVCSIADKEREYGGWVIPDEAGYFATALLAALAADGIVPVDEQRLAEALGPFTDDIETNEIAHAIIEALRGEA